MSALGEFHYVCPFCTQSFECVPECEGAACICPTCNNVIYPTRCDPSRAKKKVVPHFFEDDDLVDWAEIESALEADMEEAIEDYIEFYPDNLDFSCVETNAKAAWNSYRKSPQFKWDFKEWFETNGYERDEKDYALEEMRDEWLDEWEFQHEDDCKESWCSHNKETIKQKWHNEEKEQWMREWAETNAFLYDVTAEEILQHWKISAGKKTYQVRSITLKKM